MGKFRKRYMIVTNDEYELPVAIDVPGSKGVAEFMNLHPSSVRRNLCTKKWDPRKPYKAIEMPS